MAETEREDIRIEENSTGVWNLHAEGSIQGTYSGQFRFRCFLTPTQHLAAGREYRDLLGNNMTMASEHEDRLAWSIAQLKQRIVTAPPFWTPMSGMSGDIPDQEVITLILDAAIGAEVKYKNQLKKRKEDAIERAKKAAEKVLENVETSTDKEDEGES